MDTVLFAEVEQFGFGKILKGWGGGGTDYVLANAGAGRARIIGPSCQTQRNATHRVRLDLVHGGHDFSSLEQFAQRLRRELGGTSFEVDCVRQCQGAKQAGILAVILRLLSC